MLRPYNPHVDAAACPFYNPPAHFACWGKELPPKIQQIAAQPWTDGRRVMVSFLWEGDGPVDAEIALLSPAGDQWAKMLVVELREPRMDVTLHLRASQPTGAEGLARVRLLQDAAELDQQAIPFTLPVEPPV
jgi:hypothetical protein